MEGTAVLFEPVYERSIGDQPVIAAVNGWPF